MADKARIKKIILDKAGNPSSGAIKDLADVWADAIWNEMHGKPEVKTEKTEKASKETRVTEISELR